MVDPFSLLKQVNILGSVILSCLFLVPYPSGAMNNGFNSGCSSNTSPLEQLGLTLNSQGGGMNLGMDMGQSSSTSGGNNSMNPAASMLANMAALAQPNCKFV